MDRKRWQRLQELFERASALPADERGALLEACGDDDLRREVEAMLRAADDGEQITSVIAGELGSLAAPGGEPETHAGRRIGPYRVRRELGRGGMGVVFEAERADGEFEQRVALKLMHGSMLMPGRLERFQAERQILAKLEHPNIARLLDGGTTDEGSPYLVMESVEGEPIDAYCDRLRLTIEERLRLFRRVCAAVECAHRALVVHRDLKPSNILVTADGDPKLLDFGVAKLIETDLEGGAGLTIDGERVMTPEYASPEQVRSQPVSTATDVYALGLLLYELLCGRRAQALSSTRSEEVERVVCDAVPARPSAAVSGDPDADAGTGASPAEVAHQRRTSPARLARRLSGDLDTIVLQALRKEAERRYDSVAQLSEDVRRHLEGWPIVARGEHPGYLLRKFVGRHAAAVIALAAALALVATLTAVYVVRIAEERDRARKEAEKATRVSGFLSRLFTVSDPSESRGNSVSARELLDKAVDDIEVELAGEPEVQADLLETMGLAYRGLGLYDAAERLVEGSLERRRELLGEEHPDTLSALESLGTVYWRQGRFAEAERAHRRAWETGCRVLGEQDPEVLGYANNLGLALWRLGRYDEAARVHETNLRNLRQVLGVDHAESQSSMNNLAGVYWTMGRFSDAGALYREAAEIGERLLGPDHDKTMNAVNNLALTSKAQGMHEQALALLEPLIERRVRVQGGRHPATLGSMSVLASLYGEMGRIEDARRLHRQCFEARREVLGPDHPQTLSSLQNFAIATRLAGDTEEAERLLRQAWSRRLELMGAEHPQTLRTQRRLAELLAVTSDRRAEAIDLYRDALATLERTASPAHSMVVEIMRDLGDLLRTAGRAAEAEPLLAKAVGRVRESLPDEALLLATSLAAHGRCLLALERLEDAEDALREAYGAFQQAGLAESDAGRETAALLAELDRGEAREAAAGASRSLSG